MQKFNIVLTSNGFNNNTFRSDEIDNLFKQIVENKKVLLVTNATKEGSNANAINDIKENFENSEAELVDTIEVSSSNVSAIFDYDVLYGVGGDVRLLLEDLQECNFRKYLLKFIQTGIYIGESAGSIVLGEDVKWCYNIKKGTHPKYDIAPKTYKALGLTDKNIFPHYNSYSDEIKERIQRYEETNNIEITRLADGEYILEYR